MLQIAPCEPTLYLLRSIPKLQNDKENSGDEATR